MQPVITSGPSRVYLLSTPIPAAVLIRRISDGSERLMGQAFALPAGEERWTLFVMPFRANVSVEQWPSGVNVLLSWSDPDGNRVAAIHGDGDVRDVLAAFDQQFGRDHVTLRDVHADAATVRYETGKAIIDLRVQPDRERGWHGVVWISARR
jgi:hypothetical protein